MHVRVQLRLETCGTVFLFCFWGGWDFGKSCETERDVLKTFINHTKVVLICLDSQGGVSENHTQLGGKIQIVVVTDVFHRNTFSTFGFRRLEQDVSFLQKFKLIFCACAFTHMRNPL